MAEAYRRRAGGINGVSAGQVEDRRIGDTWFMAFPDMRIRATRRVVSDDEVAAEVEFTGTNTGPVRMGDQEIPATGKSVVGTGTYFASVTDGKIASFRAHPDVAALMAQLGLMPGM